MPERGPQHALDPDRGIGASLLAQQGLGQEAIAAVAVSRGSPLDRVKGIIQAPPTWRTLGGCADSPAH